MDKNKLKDIINYVADKQGFRPAIIEKDYYLTRILNAVNQHLSSHIIFKGLRRQKKCLNGCCG